MLLLRSESRLAVPDWRASGQAVLSAPLHSQSGQRENNLLVLPVAAVGTPASVAWLFQKMALESPFKGMSTANVVCLGLINKILAACLRKTTCVQFGKAGAHPQLAFGIAIAPETLHSHYNLSILKAIAILPILS